MHTEALSVKITSMEDRTNTQNVHNVRSEKGEKKGGGREAFE